MQCCFLFRPRGPATSTSGHVVSACCGPALGKLRKTGSMPTFVADLDHNTLLINWRLVSTLCYHQAVIAAHLVCYHYACACLWLLILALVVRDARREARSYTRALTTRLGDFGRGYCVQR